MPRVRGTEREGAGYDFAKLHPAPLFLSLIPTSILAAVSDVAKARGMTDVAAHAGLGRESLYKALRPGAQPRFDTVRRLLTALGVRLDVVATAQRR